MSNGWCAYLGDGVYAWHDGYQIWLKAERENGVHEIALEPLALAALISYAKQIKQRADAARAGGE